VDLHGRVIVITGGQGQLGRAVAHEVAARGGKAALLDIVEAPAPPGCDAWTVDLTSLDAMQAVMDAIAGRHGAIDALVNVAGGFRCQTLADSDDLAEWEFLFRTNVLTCVTASRAVLPHLHARGRGRIVNVGALAAQKAAAGMGAYAASKSGVARFTEALADELKLQGITVNAVLPSILDTPANRADMPEADPSRWVKPAQVAAVVGFLLSDAAEAVTGALLPVSGRV
jgi:NAD(P)-dependent dehydrogenase (short-subunit alcohol dehydrogenase family)